MKRSILGFAQDDESHWLAELSCGHRQHTRHAPPLVERPWVTTEAGREARIGTPLDCVRCDRAEMPDGYAAYKRTPTFTAESVPDALLRIHSTKPGVWGLIHVLEGSLRYVQHAPVDRAETLTQDAPGVVLPELEHHVECAEPVSFYVEFWRAA